VEAADIVDAEADGVHDRRVHGGESGIEFRLGHFQPVGIQPLGTVKLVEPLGEVTLAYVDIGVGEEPVVVKLQGNRMLERGATVSLAAEPGKLHAFDAQERAIR